MEGFESNIFPIHSQFEKTRCRLLEGRFACVTSPHMQEQLRDDRRDQRDFVIGGRYGREHHALAYVGLHGPTIVDLLTDGDIFTEQR